MIKRSHHSYEETVSMLQERIVAGGNTVFGAIDQAAAAKEAGLHVPMSETAARYGVTWMDGPIAAMDAALERLTDS